MTATELAAVPAPIAPPTTEAAAHVLSLLRSARSKIPAELLAGLTVQPRADGGMVLEADRESAWLLAEVLRGLAGAIEGAVGGGAGIGVRA